VRDGSRPTPHTLRGDFWYRHHAGWNGFLTIAGAGPPRGRFGGCRYLPCVAAWRADTRLDRSLRTQHGRGGATALSRPGAARGCADGTGPGPTDSSKRFGPGVGLIVQPAVPAIPGRAVGRSRARGADLRSNTRRDTAPQPASLPRAKQSQRSAIPSQPKESPALTGPGRAQSQRLAGRRDDRIRFPWRDHPRSQRRLGDRAGGPADGVVRDGLPLGPRSSSGG
jgi:hypothetical protein